MLGEIRVMRLLESALLSQHTATVVLTRAQLAVILPKLTPSPLRSLFALAPETIEFQYPMHHTKTRFDTRQSREEVTLSHSKPPLGLETHFPPCLHGFFLQASRFSQRFPR